MTKTIFDHFYDICHGKNEYSETYQPMVMDNLFCSYPDTVEFASNMAYNITHKISPYQHYLLYQLYVPKGHRNRPRYISKKVDKD